MMQKEFLLIKEDVLITKQDLINTIHHSKNEIIRWIIGIGVLQIIASLLVEKYM